MKRNLSGIFFREVDVHGRFHNTCFEELTSLHQYRILKEYDKEAVSRLAVKLADTLKEIGEQFEIGTE